MLGQVDQGSLQIFQRLTIEKSTENLHFPVSTFSISYFAFFLCSIMSKPLIVAKKRKREDETGEQERCIICKLHCDEEHAKYSPTLWSEFKDLALKWKGLDRFHDVHDTVDWASGPEDKL